MSGSPDVIVVTGSPPASRVHIEFDLAGSDRSRPLASIRVSPITLRRYALITSAVSPSAATTPTGRPPTSCTAYLRSVMGDTRIDASGREQIGTGESNLA